MTSPSPYAAEAEARWGHTAAYRESRRRAAGYGDADWSSIKAEAAALEHRFAALMAAGVPADAAPARAVAEEHRAHLSRWFYDCSPEFHRTLAALYVDDARFAAHYDEVAPGLAAYVSAAIVANAG
jgi:hypothetical protein